MKEKILLFIECLGSGGAQKQLYLLAKGLVNNGYDVEIVYYFPNEFYVDYFKSKGVKVKYIKRGKFIDFTFFRALIKEIKEGNYKIIISFLDTPNFYLELLKIVGLYNTPLIVSQRRSFGNKISTADRIKNLFHLASSYLVVNSQTHYSTVRSKFTYLKNKIKFIPNGFENDKYFQKELQVQNFGQIKYVAVARVQPIKNVLGIVKAFHVYNNSNNKRHTLTWIGKYNKNDSYYQQTRKYIIANGIENEVVFVGEISDIPTEIVKYDCLVLGSFSEGFPNVICEAFATGLPVLGSDIGDVKFLISESRAGFLFDPLDQNSIISAFDKFSFEYLSNYAIMSQNARNFASKFQVDYMIESYMSLIKNYDE